MSLDDNHSKSLLSPSVQIFFPQMQKSFPSFLSKKTKPASLGMHSESARRKPAKHKKTSCGKVSVPGSAVLSNENNLEAKMRHSGVRKRFATNKSHYSSRH